MPIEIAGHLSTSLPRLNYISHLLNITKEVESPLANVLLSSSIMFKAILECIHGSTDSDHKIFLDGESPYEEARHPPCAEDKANLMAKDIFNTILSAPKANESFRSEVEEIAPASGWTEKLAERLLYHLERAVKDGVKMGGALKEAFEEAVAAAGRFTRDHPAYCTLIALGILVVLLPWMIEVLGFAELGPVEGM